MPNYRYMCGFCKRTVDEFRPVDKRDSLPLCAECGAPMIREYVMPFISATVNPTSRPETAAAINRENRWGPDMDAYKRLRKNGMQPKRIDGSAVLEQGAETKTEIEMGRLMRTQDVKDGVDISSHMLHKDLEV